MKIKKSYKDTIIATLKCYKLLPAHIEELQNKWNEIRMNDGVNGIDYSGDGIKTNGINKLVENTALKNIEDLKEIEKELVITKAKLNRLDSAIDSLLPVESQMVRLRYVNGLGWNEISSTTLYSLRSCQYKLNESIEKLTIVFYGLRALETKKDEIELFADSLHTS